MRFYYIAVVITGILLMLNLAGIVTPTGSLVQYTGLVDIQGNFTFQNFKSSNFTGDFSNPSGSPTNSLAFILGGLITAGMVVSLFGRSPDIRYITAGAVLLTTGLLSGDLIWLFTYVQNLGVRWVTNILSLLIGSLLVGLIISAIQFWQGSD